MAILDLRRLDRQPIELVVPRFGHEDSAVRRIASPLSTNSKPPDQKAEEPASPSTSSNVASVVSPKLVKRIDPQYTQSALSHKIEGRVGLSFFVTPAGNVRKIRVIRRLDTGLDQEAIKALSHWHYSPALVNGRPIEVRITEEIEFHLP
jgi:protein TonB